MRALKFRAWYDGKMYDVMGLFFNSTGVVNCGILLNPETATIYYTGRSEVQLRQFTGLLDKNGKEIYEGDIVQIAQGTIKKEIAYVYWDKEKVCFGPFHHFIDSEERWIDLNYGIDPNHYGTEYTAEIIGNIYEHPDLLPKRGKS